MRSSAGFKLPITNCNYKLYESLRSHPARRLRRRTRPSLADRMRPRTLDEFVGQEQLVGPGKPLRVQIERDDPTSMIFWGPPGTGKTTLAKIIARMTKADFIEFSAVLAGIKEIKQVMSDADRAASTARAPSSSSTKFTASTKRSRMPSCRTWKKAAFG